LKISINPELPKMGRQTSRKGKEKGGSGHGVEKKSRKEGIQTRNGTDSGFYKLWGVGGGGTESPKKKKKKKPLRE